MQDGIKKLKSDLAILEAMASEMDSYLVSDVLFWRMMKGGMPMLTLGGYLMRQHRLLALRHLLEPEEIGRLDTAVMQFNQAVTEKIVRLEQKAHHELDARIRQWSEYLKDLAQGESAHSNYPVAVEARAMIEAIIDQLQMPPYRLEPTVPERVTMLDKSLKSRWQKGTFVWPAEWESAYPAAKYWWLYGRPRSGQ
ncbi:MAG: hypothetical protein D6706_01775 [Chloroflexi bacterium]|nr:MAG: hypothetical protein D6706_01775 [Chloroflexota bacterium]